MTTKKSIKKNVFLYRTLSALFIGGVVLSAVSCANDDIEANADSGDKEGIVKFEVTDVQTDALSSGSGITRGTITTGLLDKDFADRKLEAQSDENLDVCLIESTIEGVNPVKVDAGTRANIINLNTLSDFSSTGVRGTNASNLNESWFNDAKTKKTGELYNTTRWSWLKPHGRFFAVSPDVNAYRDKIKINLPTASGKPNVEFTVDKDVRKQVDLMTACSGNVQYSTRFRAPKTNLSFRHALTAIRFAVGPNLSFNKNIKQITIKNAFLSGKYELSDQYRGKGSWINGSLKNRGDVTLGELNYSTTEYPNSIIRDIQIGNRKYANVSDITQIDDNYTFYMIPQTLGTNTVSIEVLFTDNSRITVPLTGEWKEGTTRTYKLSQKNSNWEYKIDCVSPSAVEYNITETGKYGIISYRKVGSATMPVSWKVVGYDANDDGNYTMAEKPEWLKSLSKESGTGGTAAEEGTAKLSSDVVDLVVKRNKELQNAPALGTAAKPYNLSNNTGELTAQNTANCYVISAPGYYCIPLVYGNAIKNGADNVNSYKTSVAPVNLRFGYPPKYTDVILHTFVDHIGREIDNPWIEKTKGGVNNGVNGAEVVWADEANLVKFASNPIYRDGSNNAYVKFEVTKADIKSGNAMIAVKKGNTVVWSWHLWFAPKSALTPIPVTNINGTIYNFTTEALGWKPITWKGTPYSTPRSVKVKVEQTVGNGGTKASSVFVITQNAADVERNGTTTLYQWGRKEAFPGSDALGQGSIIKNGGNQIHMANKLQFPGKYYTTVLRGNGTLDPNDGLTKYHYFYNLWSANNVRRGDMNAMNDIPVVKTIYDPCPVGFSVPTNGAFSAFTSDGKSTGSMNVNGTNNTATYNAQSGHIFWTNHNKNATIYFPASGFREASNGNISKFNEFGDYWSADPQDVNNGCCMGFSVTGVSPLHVNLRTYGFAVRPVSE